MSQSLQTGRNQPTRIAGLATHWKLAAVLASAAALYVPTVAAQPDFQLPFPCGQKWRLDSWASNHAPALDMVKEPDQYGTEGATLVAAAAGRVNQSYYAGHEGRAGNVIQIDHGGGWFTTYIHLQSRAVAVGATVQRGQVIGKVGKTGSTANNHPHLHFEQAYDVNGDGKAEWGYVNNERRPSIFNGITYGTTGGKTYRNVVSNNCGGTPPPAPTKYWVDTFANANGYNYTDCLENGWATRCKVRGLLYTGTNYVFCKKWGDEARDSQGNYNHWWLKTDLDTNAWGSGPAYVSAYYLSRWGNDVAKDNSGRVIPNC